MKCTRGIIVAIPLTTALAILFCIIIILSRGDCPEGNFTCRSSRTCVLQRSICDGRNDCPEGEDEDEFSCRDLSGSLWAISDHIPFGNPNRSCEIEQVPNECSCKGYTLVCSKSNLTSIPKTSPDVRSLILNHNQIQALPVDVFDDFNLNFINLGYNNLTSLPHDIFARQKMLRKLFLLNNKLKTLPRSLLNLKQLGWLFLEENELSFLNTEEWNMPALTYLNLTGNVITLEGETFSFLPILQYLYLDHNRIERIELDTFALLPALVDLSIGWNRIEYIHKDAFLSLNRLKELDLKNNLLTTMDPRSFFRQLHLEKLMLGGNIDLDVEENLFQPLSSLKSLDLQGIQLPYHTFKDLNNLTDLEFIYFKRFKYCTEVPQVPKCEPLSDGTSTSEDLLGNGFLRTTLWLVSSFTLVSNGMVVWRRWSRSANSCISPLNVIITNLAAADLLMGLYLMALGIEDFTTGGNFRQKASQWRSSIFCTILGVTAMVSSEASVLILLLISVERFMLISSPLSGFQSLKPKAALMTSGAVWIFALIVALLPVMGWRHSMRFYGTNAFCFPLHIDEPYLVGWQYSAFVFIGINSISLIVIALLYVGVFVSILKTRNATTLNVNDSEFALRFFFIVLANACCWVPIILLKILAFLNFHISKDVYGWLGVFVLPVNSAVNPILYTFTTPRYRSNQTTTTGSQSHPVDGKFEETLKPNIWSRALGLGQLKPTGRTVATPRTTEEQL